MSVNRVVAQETRPSLRLVQQDTAFVSIPILSRAMVRKSEEEKAKEAADFIIDIRKNRFNLISGDIDIFPDGMAMETILNEYRKLEENYLALFTGKTFKEVIKHVFEFIPAGNKDIESYVLFRFAENKGILPTNDISGRPIIIEITKENITAALDKLFAPANNTVNENRIYYRVPDVATIKLFDERSVIAETRVHISQFGKTLSIPANFNWE